MKRPLLVMAMVSALAMSMMGAALASGTTVYSAIPDPLPDSANSFGFQAVQITEYGNHVELAEGSRDLHSVTVTLNSWACEQGAWNTNDCESSDGSTFDHPVTVNLYEVSSDDEGAPIAGDEIATVTETIAVPYRPSTEEQCVGEVANGSEGGWFSDEFDRCIQGFNVNVEFDFSELDVTLPGELVWGVAFDTSTTSDLPSGDYDSLNVSHTRDGNPAQLTPEEGRADIGTDLGTFFNGEIFPNAVSGRYTVWGQINTAPTGPSIADDCKDGGFNDFGFRNQGQCIASLKANENAGK